MLLSQNFFENSCGAKYLKTDSLFFVNYGAVYASSLRNP